MNPTPFECHALFSADHRARWGLAAAIASLMHHARPQVRWIVHVLDCGLGPRFAAHLTERFDRRFPGHTTIWHRVPDGVWRGLPRLEGSAATYGRLLAEDLVAADRCLYLDCDTLPLTCPSVLLTEPANGDPPVRAVRNRASPTFGAAHRADTLTAWAVAPDTPYFNAGMLVLNLRAWRAERAGARCLEAARRESRPYHDQDTINLHFRGRIDELDPRWNVQTAGAAVDRSQSAILHFTGRLKPWYWGYSPELAQPFRQSLREGGWQFWWPEFHPVQWMRSTRLRPWLSQCQFRARRWAGLPGLRPR